MIYAAYFALYVALGLCLMFTLAIFYWAGMHLKKMPFTGGWLGKTFIFVAKTLGGVINLSLNIGWLSVACLDFTYYGTCSKRLKDYNENELGHSWLSNWRLYVCDFWEPFVNPYDPTGTHIGGEDKQGKL
jgi:hypothetical protein